MEKQMVDLIKSEQRLILLFQLPDEEEKKVEPKVQSQPRLREPEKSKKLSKYQSDPTLPCFRIGLEQSQRLDKIFQPFFINQKEESVLNNTLDLTHYSALDNSSSFYNEPALGMLVPEQKANK